jgi:hypothetical protein
MILRSSVGFNQTLTVLARLQVIACGLIYRQKPNLLLFDYPKGQPSHVLM